VDDAGNTLSIDAIVFRETIDRLSGPMTTFDNGNAARVKFRPLPTLDQGILLIRFRGAEEQVTRIYAERGITSVTNAERTIGIPSAEIHLPVYKLEGDLVGADGLTVLHPEDPVASCGAGSLPDPALVRTGLLDLRPEVLDKSLAGAFLPLLAV
jgi:hypothetical protein